MWIQKQIVSILTHFLIGEHPYKHPQITLDQLHTFLRHLRILQLDIFEVYIVRGFLRDMESVFCALSRRVEGYR